MGDPLPFVQLPTSVIRDPGLTVVARMLYAVVATYADLTTREATLLRSTLAKDLNRSRDTVDRAVAELVKAGLLTVTHRKNDKGVSISSLYTLKHPLAAYPQVAGGRTGADTPMGNSAATGMGTPAGMGTGAATPSRMDAATVTAPVRPGSGHGCGTELEPSNENQVTRETSAQPALLDVPDAPSAPRGAGVNGTGRKTLDQHFDEFYDTYPRKVGPQAARKVWDKQRQKTPIEVILAGAARLRDDPNLPEKNYIPHPSTWLARGGWGDEP